ncbi:MAG: hypothetical protein WCP85_19760 [Mariniphaga sp.]
MEPIKKNFKDCDLYFLEKSFGLVQLEEMDQLDNWISSQKNYIIDDFEDRILNHLQKKLKYRVNDWNEYELIEHFIGPLFSVIDLNTNEYGMFSERLLKAVIGDYELSGYPDAVVAKGRRRPEIPYFCFHEYKKEKDPDGDPAGQCLAAMLVAQELNNNTRPIYGITVKGEKWQFMVLQGKEYAISNSYISTDEELYDIVKLLKHLKTIIEEFVKS